MTHNTMNPRKLSIQFARVLKIDKDFIPCTAKNRDEIFRNGFFEFNITKIIDFINSNPSDFVIEEVSVDDFPSEFSSINEEHIDSVQINKPVILAEISPNRYNLIDGNHRMEKARRIGIERIRAYRLRAEQHIRFLTSVQAYKAYIEYWNSKL